MPARGLPYGCSERRHAALRGAWRGQALQGGELHKVSYWGHGVLQGARRRQAMPAHGLLKECCQRWHAALQGAWRGQALQGGELHQVSSRRHGVLHRPWRGQAMPARGLPQGCSDRRHAALHGAWRRQALSDGGLLRTCLSASCEECVLRAMSTGHADRRHAVGCTPTARRGCIASHDR
jgi:hypothetical protein